MTAHRALRVSIAVSGDVTYAGRATEVRGSIVGSGSGSGSVRQR